MQTSLDDEKKQVKLQMTRRARAALKRAAKANDMKEFGVASRLMEWFAGLDGKAQRVILHPRDGDLEVIERSLVSLVSQVSVRPAVQKAAKSA